MPSNSLGRWLGERAENLDQIRDAHARVGGTQRGRRYATEQINHAYATLLSSQFQGFCRDLHSECVDHAVDAVAVEFQSILRTLLIQGRKLDSGNPNPGNIGSDFGRFGLSFFPTVQADFHQNDRRQEMLEELNRWRNAIAHQDFDPAKLGGTTTLHLSTVRQWRRAIDRLAQSFDNVMRSHLLTLTGSFPW
jgi:hypothetical protein